MTPVPAIKRDKRQQRREGKVGQHVDGRVVVDAEKTSYGEGQRQQQRGQDEQPPTAAAAGETRQGEPHNGRVDDAPRVGAAGDGLGRGHASTR